MTRVLAFTPYSLWRFHTDYEYTLTRACQERGAEVRHLLCDQVLTNCDMSNSKLSPMGKSPGICEKCYGQAREAADAMGVPCDWLSQHITPTERVETFAWAQGLSTEEFALARYLGHPIGAWVSSSVVTYFRAFPIDLADWNTVNVYRGFLHAGAAACVALTRLLDEWQPDALLIFNGRMSVLQIAFRLARARGVRVLVHERPLTPGTVIALENDHCLSPSPFLRFWQDWQDVALTTPQLARVARWLRDRRLGINQRGLFRFATKPVGARTLRQSLGIPPQKRLLAMFTSSTDEFAGMGMLEEGPFESQEDWIERIVAWAGTRSECALVIRTHPNLSAKPTTVGAPVQVQWFADLRTRVPENVQVVMPDDPLSSYDLMDVADAGVAYGSTAGLEMLALGKPVVTTPPLPFYADVPGVQLVTSVTSLAATLDGALQTPPRREAQRGAFRCLYRYFFEMQQPFPLVTMVGLNESQRNYQSLAALAPGRDAVLDRLCGFVLQGDSIYHSPTPEDRGRSTADEERFFQGLEGNPNWLRPNWRDRRQVSLDALRGLGARAAVLAGRLMPASVRHRVWKALPPRLRGAIR